MDYRWRERDFEKQLQAFLCETYQTQMIIHMTKNMSEGDLERLDLRVIAVHVT